MTTRQCIECGAVKPLDEFDGYTCKPCKAITRRIVSDCNAMHLDPPTEQCPDCRRWYLSYWGQFDCPHCARRRVAA